jgi:CRP/FNR family transcriptional regulator, cyclic AMP receptor protein
MCKVATSSLAAHPFLHGMPPEQLDALAEAASEVRFPVHSRLFEDGGHAGHFWLIRSGKVALDLQVPGQGPMVIETLGIGELLGWSWLFPPYRWAFGAVALGPVQAFEFNASAVRARCASDPVLGYELTRRVARVLAHRLQATRVRLIAGSAPSAVLF